MKKTSNEPSGAALGVGVAGLMVLCCAGPALIAAGALGALGGFLRNPLVIALAAAVLLLAVGGARRRGSADGGRCCPPSDRTPHPDEQHSRPR